MTIWLYKENEFWPTENGVSYPVCIVLSDNSRWHFWKPGDVSSIFIEIIYLSEILKIILENYTEKKLTTLSLKQTLSQKQTYNDRGTDISASFPGSNSILVRYDQSSQ